MIPKDSPSRSGRARTNPAHPEYFWGSLLNPECSVLPLSVAGLTLRPGGSYIQGDSMSRFSFFKRVFGGTEDKPERREKPRSPSREGTVVLVIDDSKTILALMRKMFAENGFVSLEALDAETGVEIARDKKPDLIFLDIVLPGMDGFAALRILRRDPITKGIPVIMISGNAEAAEQFYAQRIGADDFMKKPFSRPELFTRIERLFGGEDVMRRRGMQRKVTPE
jgi:CheY-like chemotaxis protein